MASLAVVLIGSALPAYAQTPTCDDLSGIDFGPCDGVLGFGVIDGECREISGCESPVPLFATLKECEADCSEPTCDDLSGIDFGECLAVLGVGVIDRECRTISGCSSPVPLFATLEDCIIQCEPIPGESVTWGRVKLRYGPR